MTDDRARAEELFNEAIAMPTGMPRHEALERAARAADAAGHDMLAATCRIALIDSCYWLNRYDLILAPIAWCRTAEQRDISMFSENELHSLNWAYKWVPVGLRRDPRFSLEQISSVLNDLESRYKRLGYSLQPVYGQRVLTAAHIGDFELADEMFARFVATERDDMSDCAGCVVEEQVEHLVSRGRYEEALRHAEPALAGSFTCTTQPEGVLTALLPALTALGEIDRARDAHLTAYRRSREQAGQGYVGLHLEFCAVTGNVPRGMELLRRHLDQVHHATSPIGTMNFAASAALLLSRLDSPEKVTLTVPLPSGATETLSALQLRSQLETTARDLAVQFDRRNGTRRQSERIQSIVDAPDTVRVPLAVPNPVVSGEPAPVSADPVELAYQAHLAYEENDFLTGYRLLKSLPADLDPLLPANLAARIAARRIIVFNARSADVRDKLAAAVHRLVEAGEDDQAARFSARLGVLTAEAGDLDGGIELAERALESAEKYSSSTGRILVRLILCELLDQRHEHVRAGELLADALHLAEETDPDRVPSILLEMADHEGRQRNLGAAESLLAQVLTVPGLRPGDRFHGLRARAAIAEVRGDVELSLTVAAELVEFARPHPGPWLPDVLLHRMTILDNLDRSGAHLPDLVDTVAVCRAEGTATDIARACYLLSSGYLAHSRLVEAAEALEEALRLLDPSDMDRVMPVRYRLATVCGELGEYGEAKKHFTAMLSHITSAPASSQAMVWTGLGAINYSLDDVAEAERCHRRSAELWELAGLPTEALHAWVKAAAAIADTDQPTALSHLARAMSHVPEGEGDLTARLSAEVLELRGYTYAQQGRHAESLADNMNAAALVSGIDEPDWQIFLMVRAARAHMALKAPAKAETLARQTIPLLTPETPQSIVARILDILSKSLEAQGKVIHQDTTARALTARLRD